jgi:cell division protease FtsH
MVTQFGMSDKVGVIAVGDREQEIFLGREIAQRREISERMSEAVDGEIKRLLDERTPARVILLEHRETLDRMAEVLLERETIDREEVEAIARGETLPPRDAPSPPAGPPPAPAAPVRAAPESPGLGPVLGAPPVKPAGA